MRKFFLITLLLAIVSNLAVAQDLSNVLHSSSDEQIRMIPNPLTKDGHAVAYLFDENKLSISILDKNFQVVEQFTITEIQHGVLDRVCFVNGDVGPVAVDSYVQIEYGNLLVKDIFGEGYNYMSWPDETNRIHIYNSDNKEISRIDFPKGYEMKGNSYHDFSFLTLGENLYFVIGGLTNVGSEDEYYTAFYRIDDVDNSVTLVSIAPSAKISPRAPRKGEKVTVTIDSDLLDKDCMVKVVSASGHTLLDTKIPAGQAQLDINTSEFSKGVYIVTVIAEGVSKEAAKIIIR